MVGCGCGVGRSCGRWLQGCVLAVALGACGHVPVASMIELAKIDFATTDFAELRAAARLPPPLAPQHGQTRLKLVVAYKDGGREERVFVLREVTDPAERAQVARLGAGATAFRLDPADAAKLAEARTEIKTRKAEGRRGSVTLSVEPGACRTAPLPAGSLLVSTYLRTAETGSYVALTRDADLTALIGPDKIAEIPLCGGAWPHRPSRRLRNASRSNRCTSCSFLSSAPCSGGISLLGSRSRSVSGAMSSTSSSFSQSSSSRGRGLLLEARHLAHLEEDAQRLRDQPLLDAGEVHVDDGAASSRRRGSGCSGRSSGAGRRPAAPSRCWR